MGNSNPHITDAIGINIQKFIVHILDPPRPQKTGNRGFVTSEAELNLQENSELRKFFTKHIESSLASPSCQSAKFKNINHEDPSGICAEILNNNSTFVDGSQKIAKKLYETMKDGRTKEADLAIAIYEAKNFPGKQFIALLKIDPSIVFLRDTLELNGKKVLSYKLLPSAFTNQKLQKCAFVQSIIPARHPDYDMVILEPKSTDVAQYFKDKFLESVESFDSKTRTENLFYAFIQAGNYFSKKNDLKNFKMLEQQRESALKRTKVNYDELIDALELNTYDKEKVRDIFHGFLPDREVVVDKKYVEKITGKRVFSGAHGLKVQIENRFYDQTIYLGDEIIENGEVVARKIIIHAKNWREIKK